MKNFLFTIIIGVFLLTSYGYPQSIDKEVEKFIKMIEQGEIEKASEESVALIEANPNNPAVLYLKGRLCSNGIEALKFYQAVVDNFPKSEWADDALYKIYQYYYAIGLYRTAELRLKHLQKEYPNSPYLAISSPSDIKNLKEEKPAERSVEIKSPPVEVVVIDTPKSVESQPVATEIKTNNVYTLQVGAFSTMANAEKQKKFFKDLGYEVEIINKIRVGKNLFLVWVGNFSSAEEANIVGNEIKQKYKIESLTIQKY